MTAEGCATGTVEGIMSFVLARKGKREFSPFLMAGAPCSWRAPSSTEPPPYSGLQINLLMDDPKVAFVVHVPPIADTHQNVPEESSVCVSVCVCVGGGWTVNSPKVKGQFLLFNDISRH